MTFKDFEALVWEYDAKHKLKAAKNKRVYRNPNAALHYGEALARARDLIGDGFELIKALDMCFTQDFWPLKTFKAKLTKES